MDNVQKKKLQQDQQQKLQKSIVPWFVSRDDN